MQGKPKERNGEPLRKVILLIPSAREYERGFLRGIVEYVQSHEPWVFYEQPPAYLAPLGPKQRLAHMRAWKANGIIAHQAHAAELQVLHLPAIVMCSVRHCGPRVCHVWPANESIGQMAADYLLGLGLRKLAYCGLAAMEWSTVRGKAFRQRAAQAGIAVHLYAPPSSCASESWFTESACLGAWLEQLPKPIGLMACNDERARMVADVCRTRAIRVPDDIAILGVDNDEHVCLRTTPALSSLALATERAGYDAAALLDRLLSGKKVDSRVIVTRPVGVVPRQSTDLIASNDPNVVKAVRFIREQSKRVVQVPDVAAAAGLSRRVLQERFKRSMGNTVLEAIHASRIQNLRFLLAETTMPVAAIAAACGYETDTHLARFFTRHTGMTPSAYRRLHHKG